MQSEDIEGPDVSDGLGGPHRLEIPEGMMGGRPELPLASCRALSNSSFTVTMGQS